MEDELIAYFSKKIKIGDDCAILPYKKDLFLLTSTDTLVENVHFKRTFMSAQDIGAKAVEQNVSDIAAMGGTPKHLLVSFIVPKNMPHQYVSKVFDAIVSRAKKYKSTVVGGNISSGDTFSVTISILGAVQKKQIAKRNTAKPGEDLFVSGPLGGSGLGLVLCKKKIKSSLRAGYTKPKAQLAYAQKVTKLGVKTMMDVTDGLAKDLKKLCAASTVGATVDNFVVDAKVIVVSKRLNINPIQLFLEGGEDYRLLFTANKKTQEKIKKNKIKLHKIGTITKDTNVKFKFQNVIYNPQGYSHFKEK